MASSSFWPRQRGPTEGKWPAQGAMVGSVLLKSGRVWAGGFAPLVEGSVASSPEMGNDVREAL